MKLVSLISGGIDSPVAAYLMLRKGQDIVALHFDNRPFTDDKQLNKARRVVKKLEEISGKKVKMYIVPHGQTQIQIARNTIRKLGCLLCRRMMYRVAEKVAEKEGASALVTGESLGQVASQTLRNIRNEEEAIRIPILRPLIGLDKVEIESIARKIGTYEISVAPGLCCTIVPQKPSTHSNLEAILKEEASLDLEGMASAALEKAEIL